MQFDNTSKIDKPENPMYKNSKAVELKLTDEFKAYLENQVLGMFNAFLGNDGDEFHVKDLNPSFVLSLLEKHYKIDTDYVAENGWQNDVWYDFSIEIDGETKTYDLWYQGYDGSFKIYKKEEDLE